MEKYARIMKKLDQFQIIKEVKLSSTLTGLVKYFDVIIVTSFMINVAYITIKSIGNHQLSLRNRAGRQAKISE